MYDRRQSMAKGQNWEKEGERRRGTQEREREIHRETSTREIGGKRDLACQRPKTVKVVVCKGFSCPKEGLA